MFFAGRAGYAKAGPFPGHGVGRTPSRPGDRQPEPPRARRFSGIPEYARWTLGKAELVIPWFGDHGAQTLTLFASGMPKKAGSTYVSISVENFPVLKDYPIGDTLKEHEFLIPAGSVRTGDKKRVVLTIESNTWNPAEYDIGGYPDRLGLKVYWVRISKNLPLPGSAVRSEN